MVSAPPHTDTRATPFEPRWWPWGALVFAPVLIALTMVNRGLHLAHIGIGVLFVALAWLGPRCRRLSWLVLPMLLVGLAYENFTLLVPMRPEVHVADLYHLEQQLFSVDGAVILPHYFSAHTNSVLDFITGLAYLAFVPVVFGMALWLFFTDPQRMQLFGWAFFATHMMGLAIWFLYPAAPPWYVQEYGLGPAQMDVAANIAGAARFDELLGVDIFSRIYSRSSNVFGAMPSLHVAYPAVAMFATWTAGPRWRAGALLFTALVGFSAVYLNHHYVLDVLAGVAVAALGFAMASLVGMRAPSGNVLASYETEIASP